MKISNKILTLCVPIFFFHLAQASSDVPFASQMGCYQTTSIKVDGKDEKPAQLYIGNTQDTGDTILKGWYRSSDCNELFYGTYFYFFWSSGGQQTNGDVTVSVAQVGQYSTVNGTEKWDVSYPFCRFGHVVPTKSTISMANTNHGGFHITTFVAWDNYKHEIEADVIPISCL